MSIVIYHNPECGTSRNVLAIIEAAGYQPTVIDYLKTGWTIPQLLGLFAAAGLTPKSALRTTKSPAAELGLLDANVSDRASGIGQPSDCVHAKGCSPLPTKRDGA